MELKSYQKKVMDDLSLFMQEINEEKNIFNAWESFWKNKDLQVGNQIPFYNNEIKGVPQVCMKVPTGGGKTFMACAAIKRIFDNMPTNKTRTVVWLVPSESILVQTIKNLSNANHPYRQKLDTEFDGRVGIYTKEMLLNGQNFNPDTVREMLTICVISYDSLRSKSKDGRRVYKENGNLKRFADLYSDDECNNLDEIPETALIQTLRHLEPIVIVDESHNAVSDLSIEMLQNLNPSFILELTATPKGKSNIVSYVDARELKKENMVKLPVIVYNRNSVSDVIRDAISMRCRIEKDAVEQEKQGGKYIRPIVLFQAQPKTNEDSETFEKIKKKLLDAGIPENEIAIKTANINEIKEDLLSKECSIRYIITVNALKEGWDCPFAYILASLANKTSTVDVEQILGRILRKPYTMQYKNALLNTSYVFTSSKDFHATLSEIITGLNKAGFSKKEYRIGDETFIGKIANTNTVEQLGLIIDSESNEDETTDIIDDIDSEGIKNAIENINSNGSSDDINKMIQQAVNQTNDYDKKIEEDENSLFAGGEYSDMKQQNLIHEKFINELNECKLPQFFIRTQADLFGGEYSKLEPENLSEGFILNEQDAKIKFDLATGEIYKVDIDDNGEAIPKYKKISTNESEFLRKTLASKPKDEKIKYLASCLAEIINRNNTYSTNDVKNYVNRIIENMSDDELSALEISLPTYAIKIKEKIERLERAYREDLFYKWIDNGKIVCKESYIIPKYITPLETIDSIPLTLYTAEKNDLNGLENKIIDSIVGLDNIKWWHRIIERNDFCINGCIKHYPDFMVMTKSNKIIFVEAKGDDRDNSDSRMKLKLGRKWQYLAGNKYRYFMVFENQELNEEGAYTINNFIEVLKEL